MRKIFIDCGGNVGQSVELFKKSSEYKEEFEIYSFEPAPQLMEKFRLADDTILIQKAVWIEDGTLDFYINQPPYEQSCSLMKGKTTGNLDKENPVKVEAIDFSKWIKKNFNKDDYILLKMDIEGAEYEVMDKMIEDDSISYINKLYIEWHWSKIKGIKESVHINLLEKLKTISTLEMNDKQYVGKLWVRDEENK